MPPGLMQRTPLLISSILRYAATAHGDREIVSRLIDESLLRFDCAALAGRAARLASALSSLGVQPGSTRSPGTPIAISSPATTSSPL